MQIAEIAEEPAQRARKMQQQDFYACWLSSVALSVNLLCVLSAKNLLANI